jgi:hypothetical protein
MVLGYEHEEARRHFKDAVGVVTSHSRSRRPRWESPREAELWFAARFQRNVCSSLGNVNRFARFQERKTRLHVAVFLPIETPIESTPQIALHHDFIDPPAGRPVDLVAGWLT